MSDTLAPTLTAHARIRCQQRGIPQQLVENILDHGVATHVGGAERYSFNKAARRRSREQLGEHGFRAIERSLNAYVILSHNGRVVTVAHRTRRFRRD